MIANALHVYMLSVVAYAKVRKRYNRRVTAINDRGANYTCNLITCIAALYDSHTTRTYVIHVSTFGQKAFRKNLLDDFGDDRVMTEMIGDGAS